MQSGGGDNIKPPNNHGKGGGGGGNGDSPFNNTNNMEPDDKYFLKGQFAKRCLRHIMPPQYFEHIKNNPYREIRDINIIREIIDSPLFIYKPAFDMLTHKIHFYCEATKLRIEYWNSQQCLEEITNMTNFTEEEMRERYKDRI